MRLLWRNVAKMCLRHPDVVYSSSVTTLTVVRPAVAPIERMGSRQDYTLDGMPLPLFWEPKSDLVQPIPCPMFFLFFGGGRKPENPDRHKETVTQA